MGRGWEPEELGLGLTILGLIRGLNQGGLAEAARLPASAVSKYARGETTPSPPTLQRLLDALRVGPPGLERSIALVRSIREGAPPGEGFSELSRSLGLLLEREIGMRGSRLAGGPPDSDERRRAPELWARLRRYSAGERRAIVLESEELRSWALCELLCEESAGAAAHSAIDARERAELALLVAVLMSTENERWSFRLQGYAWTFVGNARRVQGDLPGADEAFRCSKELWQAGAPADPGLLDEARLLDLEASLRREQRRLSEALALLDQALPLAHSGEVKGRILVKRGKTLEELGDYEGAVATLRRAAPLVDEGKDPRLLLVFRFNLLENLFQTGRFSEAESMFPGVRELTAVLGNELDLVRLRWLEGRVAAGLDRVVEAEQAFREVWGEFMAREIGYDAALVSLELAVLLAEQERTREVKELARQIAPLFKAQGVDRETLATLRLFCQAADKEMVTASLARRFLKDVKAGRKAPGAGGA
jgi:tetratricopeptide (TPR) repeat protein